MLIGKDGGLSTLYHSWGFECKQRMLKTIPSPGYLDSEDGRSLTMAFIANIYIYIYIYISSYIIPYLHIS